MILLKNFLKILKNTSKYLREDKKIFVASGIFLILVFMILIGILFYSFFTYLVNYIPGGYIFAPKMLGVIMTLVFSFIILLSFIATIPTMFKNKELPFLQVLPLHYHQIFSYNFAKVIYYSLYGSLFLLIPTLIAYWLALEANILDAIVIIISILLLTLLAASIWVWVFWVISLTILALPSNFQKILLLAIILGFIYSLKIILPYISISSDPTNIIENYVFTYNYQNLLLPSNRFTQMIIFAQQQQRIKLIAMLSFSIATITLIYESLRIISQKFYLQAIQNINNFHIFDPKRNISFNKKSFTLHPYLSLFMKDLLIHLRDPSQWTQFLVFGALLFVYIATIKWTTINNLQDPTLVSILTLGNLWVVTFFLGGIALRFVFPNISLEGRAFWILKLLPINIDKIYIIKFIFFFLGIITTSLLLSYFYLNILGILPSIQVYIYLMTIAASYFTTAVFFSFGSAFPSFEESNPSKIATSYWWLLAIFVSNIVILAILAILFHPFLNLYKAQLFCQSWPNLWPWIIITQIFLYGLGYIFLKLGQKAFKKLEI